jgi:hypothetical protein
VIGQLGGGNSLAAKRAMIDGTVRIAGDFGRFAVFGVNENATAAMTHPAVAFYHRVISVNFHFPFNVGKFEFNHGRFPSLGFQQI